MVCSSGPVLFNTEFNKVTKKSELAKTSIREFFHSVAIWPRKIRNKQAQPRPLAKSILGIFTGSVTVDVIRKIETAGIPNIRIVSEAFAMPDWFIPQILTIERP